jgi:hypothetical protein
LEIAFAQGVVNLGWNVSRIRQLCHIHSEMGSHISKDMEVTIAQGMMKEHSIGL